MEHFYNKLNANTVTGLIVFYGYLSAFTAIPRFIQYCLIGLISLLSARYIIFFITHSRKKLTSYALIAGALTVTYVSAAPHLMFALYLATAYFAEQKSARSMVKTYFIMSTVLFLTTILLYAFGALPDNSAYRFIESGNTIIRSSLGFTNPNSPMLYALPIVASAYYLFGSRLLFYLLSIPFVLTIYKLTDSRTGIACMSLLFLSGLMLSSRRGISRMQQFALRVSFLLFTALSVWLAATSDSHSTLNTLLSNRLGFWRYYIENRSWLSLVGGGIEDGRTLDNAYIFILYGLGFVVFMIYAFIYYKGIKSISPKDTRLSIILVVYMIYGIFETGTIMTSVNFSLPLILFTLISATSVRSSRVRILSGNDQKYPKEDLKSNYGVYV